MNGVVLILGEESFLARQAIASTLARQPELEVTRFAGDSVDTGRLLDEVRTPTLLGGLRAVVVEHAAPLLEDESLDALAAYAQRPVKGTLLILQSPKLDGRFKAAKKLMKAAAETIKCEPLKTWAVAKWVGDRAREAHGLRMGTPAAEALRARVGEDLGLLDGALVRLKAQVAPRDRIEVADVEDSTGDHRSPILFEAANALEDADLDGALGAVGAAFAEGVRIRRSIVTETPGIALILLGQLHGAYLKLIRFHMLGGDAAAAGRAGVSPKAARYFLARAQKHSLDRLLDRHRCFLDADLGLKKSLGTPRQVLESLLVDLLT